MNRPASAEFFSVLQAPSPARLTPTRGSCLSPVHAVDLVPGVPKPAPGSLPRAPPEDRRDASPLPFEAQSRGLAGKPPASARISGHARRTPGSWTRGARRSAGVHPAGKSLEWAGRAGPTPLAGFQRALQTRPGRLRCDFTASPSASRLPPKVSEARDSRTPKGVFPQNDAISQLARAAQTLPTPNPRPPAEEGGCCVSPLCRAKEGGGRGLGVESLRDLEKLGTAPKL